MAVYPTQSPWQFPANLVSLKHISPAIAQKTLMLVDNLSLHRGGFRARLPTIRAFHQKGFLAEESKSRRRYRFGVFHLETSSGELFKHGTRIKLQDQPFRVLELLLETPGQVVSREDLRKRLWDHDTYVDFDHSLNISINKLRDALSDAAATPRFIETLPKRGYRFIAPVAVEELGSVTKSSPAPAIDSASSPIAEPLATQVAAAAGSPATLPSDGALTGPEPSSASRPRRSLLWAGLSAVVLLLVVGGLLWSGNSLFVRPKGRVMLAVLPFENLAQDQHDQYLIAGLHDEIIAQLGQVNPSKLGVIARTSVLQYANQQKPIDQIGRELRADYVLEGSVRNVQGRIRIRAELIKVSDQTQLWVETYEPQMEDILSLEENVAHQVATTLSMEFLPQSETALQQSTTHNAEAYQAYLKGRFLWYQETRQSLDAAIGEFQKAITLDPNYAPAYVGLADAYNVQGGYGFLPPEEVFPKGKEAAAKALEIAPNLSDAYNSMAFSAFYYDRNWPEAEELFKKALSLNPNNAVAHEFYSSFLHAMARVKDAQAENAIAQTLDPQSGWLHDDLGWMLLSQRQPEAAIAEFRRATELTSRFPAAHLSLAVAYSRVGRFQDALSETRVAEQLGGEPTRVLEVRGSVLAKSGDSASAQAVLVTLESGKVNGRVSPYSVALIYCALGKKSQAVDWLEKANREKDPWLVWIKVLVEWDSLRSEARFNELLRSMNL